jgi:dephospho-CoA kinase
VRVYGLTGNIGSGKSTVGRMLAEAGVPVIDADRLARDVVEPGTSGLAEIAARFPGVVGEGGRLDRKALAARIFRDPVEREALNQIVHPRIAVEMMERLGKLDCEGAPLAVYEAALIVENGVHAAQHGLIVVTAPEATMLERVRSRDGLGEADARARLSAQLPQAEKVKLATWVIDNGGSLESLRAQVAQVLAALRAGLGAHDDGAQRACPPKTGGAAADG